MIFSKAQKFEPFPSSKIGLCNNLLEVMRGPMSTVLSANVEMKDPEKFKEYSPKAIASMEPYGGKLMLRAKVEKVIHGPIPHQVIALFEFPDSAAIDTWYNSDEYQALVPLRDEAAVIRFAVAESF